MNALKALTAATFLAIGGNLLGATAYLSTIGFGGGATFGNPTVSLTPGGGSVDLHIYFVPDPGDAAFVGIGLNVTSSAPGVASFGAFSVSNPDIVIPAAGGADSGDDRWNGTGGALAPGLITNMVGVSVDQAGLDLANDGSGVFLDEGYDATAGAFYFGVVTVDPVAVGSSDISLAVGSGGVARTGDAPLPVGPVTTLTFGASEPTTVTGDDFGATGTVSDATITVIPEPSTVGLLGASLLAGIARRRRPRA